MNEEMNVDIESNNEGLGEYQDYNSIVEEALGNSSDDSQDVIQNEQPKSVDSEDDEGITDEELLQKLGREPEKKGDEAESKEETEESEITDLELNGKTYQVPKAVKEALNNGSMMQSDYTKKTQALAEERANMVAEFEKTHGEKIATLDNIIKENNEKLQTYEQWDHLITGLEEDDPDLYSALADAFKDHSRHYNNPVIEKFRNENQELRRTVNEALEKINKSGDQRESDIIQKNYNDGIKEIASKYSKKMENLGIKIDFANDVRIKQQYADGWNHKEDRGLTPEEAFLQAYAPEMNAAIDSKLKLNDVRNKVAKSKKVPTSGSVRGGSFDSAKISLKGSYEDVAREAMQAFG